MSLLLELRILLENAFTLQYDNDPKQTTNAVKSYLKRKTPKKNNDCDGLASTESRSEYYRGSLDSCSVATVNYVTCNIGLYMQTITYALPSAVASASEHRSRVFHTWISTVYCPTAFRLFFNKDTY